MDDVTLSQVRAITILAAIGAMSVGFEQLSPHLKILRELSDAGCTAVKTYQDTFYDTQLSVDVVSSQCQPPTKGQAWLGRYKDTLHSHPRLPECSTRGETEDISATIYPFRIQWDADGKARVHFHSSSDYSEAESPEADNRRYKAQCPSTSRIFSLRNGILLPQDLEYCALSYYWGSDEVISCQYVNVINIHTH